MIRDFIQFGSKKILYQLEYRDRKTLDIAVFPDRKVIVKAPIGVNIAEVRKKLKRRAPWILRQQSYFLSFEPRTPQRRYISGETHLYLGRQYRLKIVQGTDENARLKGCYFIISTQAKKNARFLMQNWYQAHAEIKFREYAEPLIARFRKYSVVPSSIIIKWLSKRWGSCTPKGRIILNTELIKSPKGCVEYVIVHELCHLVHRNHTRAFFKLQSKEMPDWEKWKDVLERMLV